jgi:hypothetical protein
MTVDWRKSETRACGSHGEGKSAKNEVATYTMLFCCGKVIGRANYWSNLRSCWGNASPMRKVSEHVDLLKELSLLPFAGFQGLKSIRCFRAFVRELTV